MHTNHHRLHRHHGIALAVIAVLDAPLLAHALPQGGQVVEGQVTIGAPAAGQMGISQGSARAVVDWRSFGIGANERVSLAQPAGGAALFRVTGSDPSQIFGSLSATGALFLSNPNGVLFGAGARVDVGSLAATTLGMTNADFMAGRLRLAGDSRASVVNEGRIDAAPGGSVVLLGASVANSGTINVPQGSVALGAGSAATLDVYGNGLLKLNLTAGADGARIDHAGTITADGGTASAAAQGAASVLNIGGVVRALSLERRGGAIYLSGGAGAKANVAGTLDASGTADGGRIDVRAERIDVAAGAVLRADAGANGNGGTIDAIATDAMRFDGHVSALGGAAGGDGGNAEISGYATLAMNGSSDLRADAGRFGTLVLDPGSFTILRSNGNINNTNQISDTALATLLGTNSVTLRTATATNNADETISVDVNANVTWNTNATLTLEAGRNIVVNAGAVINSSSATSARDAIVMTAGGTSPAAASFSGISMGAATLNSSGGVIRLTGTGGNSGANNVGILLSGTTVAGNAGGVALTGTGGTGTDSQNVGVWLQGTTSVTTANNGLVAIDGTGRGAGGTTSVNIGIVVPTGANVTLQSNGGAMSFNGRGGLGTSSFGILFEGTASASASTLLSLAGTGGGTNDGIRIGGGVSTLAGTNGGNVTLTADRMGLASARVSTSGTVTLTTQTAGRAISVGGADSGTSLGLSAVDLAGFAPSGTLQIGTNTGGSVSVDAAFAPAAGTGTLRLLSGGTVDVTAAVTGGSTRLNLSGTSGVRLGAALSSNAANVASTRAITIRTPGTFDNAVGATALTTPNGTWAVSLATPIGQNFNGLLSGNTAVWSNAVTSAVNPTGNRYSFALAPTVFIDAGTASKVYGDTLPTTVALNNTPVTSVANTFGGVFTDYAGATLGGSYTRTSAGLAATANAGTYTDLAVTNAAGVTSSLLGYAMAVGATGTVTVDKRNLTLTPDAQTRVYGNANPARGTATATTGTFVNGDAVRDVALASPADATSNVGAYDLTGSGAVFSTGLDSNYTIGYATRTGGLSVTQRPITFGFIGFISRPYGGGSFDASQAQSRITSGSIAAGDSPTTALNVAGVPLSRPVGDYSVPQFVRISRGGADVTANYAMTLDPGTLRVTRRPVTLTPDALSRAYGDANPATGTAVANAGAGVGLVFGDTVSQVSLSSPAAATSDVGSYPTTAGNAVFSTGSESNYAITYATNATGLQVTPRLLTITPGVLSREYGNANPGTAPAVGNNLVNGNTLGTLTLATLATPTSDVGSYETTGSNAVFTSGLASNYTISYAANANGLAVTRRLLTLTPDAVSRVYGDANPARGSAAVTAGSLVGSDAIADVALASPAVAGSFVGSYALSAAGAVFGTGSAGNYAITYADRANGLTVTQRPVTLTLQGSASRPYGGGATTVRFNAPTVTSGSLASGDQIFGFSASFAGPVLTAPVGAYGSTFIGVTLTNAANQNVTSNYAITRVDAPFFVIPRPLTLTPVAVSRTYGDANPATAGVTADVGFGVGLVNGDTVSQLALSTAATPASNAGLYPTTGSNAVFTTGAASNYTITYGTNATGLNVTPRLLTVTPVATTRIYGDANPTTAGATGDNLVNGDTLASVTITSPATPASNVGLAPTDASAALFSNGLASNYTIGYARNPAGLDITPRPITLAASPLSRFYGDATPATGAAVPTVGTIVNGDTVGSVTLSTPALVTSPVGGYDLDASNAVFSVGNAANYAISYVTTPGGLLINPRPLTLTPDPVTRTYGDANPAVGSASVTAGNLVNGDTLGTLTLASAADLRSGVGSYLLDGANPLFTVGAAGNYAIAIAPLAGGLTVTPRALVVTPDALARIYGDANPATATASADNLVNGDTIASVSVTTPATPASNVGTYPTDASAALFSNGAAGNYTIRYARNPAGLDVTPRPLTLTPNPTTRPYGDANPLSFTAFGNAGGLVNGDSVASVTLSTSATPASNVGSYDTTGSNALFANGLATNYTIAYATNPAGLDVTPRALTLTPVATTRLYGDANPLRGTATGNPGGLVNGDSVASVSLATPAAVTSNVGVYDTTAGNALFATGLATNYAITYATNTLGLDVTARPLVVTPDAVSRLYGDANPTTATARGDNLVNGDTLASVSVASAAAATSNVGTYTTSADNALFASGLASNYLINYADNANGLAITPRPLTLTPDAAVRTYGDANPARGSATGNAGGLVNGDTVASVALASPAVVNSGIGRYDLTASDALFGQGNASNYLLSYATLPSGLLITPRSVDVAALPGQAKVAGRPDPVFDFGITGGSLVAGDAFSGSLTRAAGEALGSYPILQGTLTLGPNYTLGYTGAPFTVASTDAIAVIDRSPAPGTPAVPADLLATLAPPAAGPTGADTPAVDCVREAPLGGGSGARLVNRGIRLPAGVADACRAPGS